MTLSMILTKLSNKCVCLCVLQIFILFQAHFTVSSIFRNGVVTGINIYQINLMNVENSNWVNVRLIILQVIYSVEFTTLT